MPGVAVMPKGDKDYEDDIAEMERLAKKHGIQLQQVLPKAQVQAQLTLHLRRKLQQKAKRVGINESEAIRRAIEFWLEQDINLSYE